MNRTETEPKITANATARPSLRLGVLAAAAAVAVAAWTGPWVGSGVASPRSAVPGSGYAQIDTSDHPTNPATCRYGAC